MKQRWTTAQVRRLAWIAGGGAALLVMVPLVPTVASAFSGGSSVAKGVGGPTILHLDIVAAGTKPGPGQVAQPPARTPMFVGCAAGRAVGGGFSLPATATAGMTLSAPDDKDPTRWLFNYPGQIPVGSKFYAVCWGG